MKNMMPDDLRCVKVEWENQLQEISKELNELGGQSIPLMWNLPMVLSIVMRSHGTLTWKRGMPTYFATCDSSTQRFVTKGFSISWLNLCPCQRLADPVDFKNSIVWSNKMVQYIANSRMSFLCWMCA